MEGKKEADYSSSSSLTSDPFGSKQPSVSSSSRIFGSIFAPPSKVLGRASLHSKAVEKEQDPAHQIPNTKAGAPETEIGLSVWSQFCALSDPITQISEGKSKNIHNKDMSSVYEEDKIQPCHLSSSIYYGGQDVYYFPQNNQSSSYSTFCNDVEEDDLDKASRGNWWQGSLYY